MAHVDFLSVIHKSTARDYLARVNDPEYPKAKAAELAKKWDFDYWDGDRRINYGGYRYMPGRWEKVATRYGGSLFVEGRRQDSRRRLWQGFLLYDFTKVVPGIEVYGTRRV